MLTRVNAVSCIWLPCNARLCLANFSLFIGEPAGYQHTYIHTGLICHALDINHQYLSNTIQTDRRTIIY